MAPNAFFSKPLATKSYLLKKFTPPPTQGYCQQVMATKTILLHFFVQKNKGLKIHDLFTYNNLSELLHCLGCYYVY